MSEKEHGTERTEELNSEESCINNITSSESAFGNGLSASESISAAIKRPVVSTTVKLLLIGLLIASVIIFITGYIKYTELKNDKEALQAQIKEKEEDIEEAEYLLDIPLTDKDYIIRIAKEKLGLFLPDEIVYYSDLND